MEITIQFNFMGKQGHAIALVDYKEQPCFIFARLEGEELLKEFGDDITIKTDCERVLEFNPENKTDGLRLTILEAIKTTKEFAEIKLKYSTSKRWPVSNKM